MSPGVELWLTQALGFPRVSGDEPADNSLILVGGQFSPRERG